MATQITYKGSTLTSFTNTTKTLKTSGKYMEDDVVVTESISLQSKTATPTESTQTITPGTGYEGLSQVTVGAISSNYVGSNIPVRTADDLTTSASTITTPAGYYSSAVSKSIETGTATTPATTITTNPAISVNTSTGLITASYSGSSNVTPTIVSGYVSQGTAGKISTAGNVTYQLTSQPAQTITPSTSNQTIASGTYLTGSQTILGDVNLVPSNIKSGVSIFGVQGNIEGGNTFIQDEEDVHGGTIRTITTNQMVSGISVITSNGLHTVASFYSASVNVVPNLQSKSVNPSETAQTITPDSNYDGLSQVSVRAISSTYVGTGIARKSAADLTVSGATVTAPTGYYASNASKAVQTTTLPVGASNVPGSGYMRAGIIYPDINVGYLNIPEGYVSADSYYLVQKMYLDSKSITGSGTYNASDDDLDGYSSVTVPAGSATTPSTSVTANPTISVNSSTGLITATASTTKSVTPTVSAGYVSSGTAGTITVSGSNTSQLSTQGAATITPTESEQTAVASGKYTTGVVKVGAISSTYVGSGIDRNDSTDLTVSGATVTVPSGYYESQASKSVVSGTEGTPTATKGTISNHSVSVTPSVTNTAGYIAGSTKTGTAVTVSASELVSGTKSITENGTGIDVTNYASVDVEVPGSLNTYIIELTNSGSAGDYIAYNNVQYNTAGDIIEVNEGDTVTVSAASGLSNNYIYLNDTIVQSSFHGVSYNYTAASNVKVSFSYSTNVAKVYLSEVSDVVPLSITENGTYTASGTTRGYSPVTVSVSSGADVPVFETVWSSDYETTTVTCNKTFAECLTYCENSASWAYEIETVEGDEENVFEHALSSIIYSSQSITYIRIQNGIQSADIIYYSDGHIDFIQPSEYLIDETITQNGYYSPLNGGVYGAVTVSVPSPSGTYNITSNGIYDITNYASASVSVAGGGGISVDDIAMRAISGVISGSATKVGSYAFGQCQYITTASFPEATLIGTYAFNYCVNLTSISFPNVTSIHDRAFNGCSRIKEANFSEVTSVGSYAFAGCYGLSTISFPLLTSLTESAFAQCSSLTTASFPEVTSIGGNAFYRCIKLTTVSFPKATSIGSNAFNNCSSLTSVFFPEVTSVGSYAFSACSSLTTASFPKATTLADAAFSACIKLRTVSVPEATRISNYAFYMCSSLSTLILPKATSIGNNAFRSCHFLISLYLLGSSVCSLGGSSAFTSSPIGGYRPLPETPYGSIFVPSSLYDGYISSRYWSAYSSRFASLTDAEIEALLD